MLHHLSVAPRDIVQSIGFYVQALAPLGIKRMMSHGGTETRPSYTGFGHGSRPYFFLVSQPQTQGYVHIAFAAESEMHVEAFYQAAISAGGSDNGPPGVRRHYHERYYSAFVLDPDGFNIEAVHWPGF